MIHEIETLHFNNNYNKHKGGNLRPLMPFEYEKDMVIKHQSLYQVRL
jgi:hypothetical protein